MAGAPVDEIIATLLTFGLSMPTAGLERSVRKAECRFPVFSGHRRFSFECRLLADTSHSAVAMFLENRENLNNLGFRHLFINLKKPYKNEPPASPPFLL